VSAVAVACGVLVLALAAVGLFAITSFAVTQRAREIGIRVALGASTSRVLGLFMESGYRLVAVGLAIGLPVSLIVLRLLPTSFGVRTSHVAILLPAIVAVVAVTASVATWIPARRAAANDPVDVLRID
jgi:ABC-type antimicrobial peptide transport system permease subunit